jgi:hypothetical protein
MIAREKDSGFGWKFEDFEFRASTSWPSSSGLRGRRKTYLTILKGHCLPILKWYGKSSDPVKSGQFMPAWYQEFEFEFFFVFFF